jgi:hypothetical protein
VSSGRFPVTRAACAVPSQPHLSDRPGRGLLPGLAQARDRPEGAAVVECMRNLAESGLTPGRVSKTLKAEGHRPIRRALWQTRALRHVLTNVDYAGVSG